MFHSTEAENTLNIHSQTITSSLYIEQYHVSNTMYMVWLQTEIYIYIYHPEGHGIADHKNVVCFLSLLGFLFALFLRLI